MKFSNILFSLIAVILIIILIPDAAISQPGLPGSPEQAPIDGGLALLAAAGGGYAIKKLRDRSKD